MSVVNYLIKCMLPFLFYSGFTKSNIIYDLQKFYLLENDIRNLKNVSDEEFDFVKTLPKEKVLDIIKIYLCQTESISYSLDD
jgi:hypothetical protein